ncbi:type VI secretion system PAAR protein [Aeromonas hydrophila]|nr:type VI secretion system PAAR protein [Aeromonas hydrophila]MCP1266286.1 type VI secretion system PAAR protein [Aeromonas hydrophila]MCP1294421.1 type VI secretion system PAAR protein [Aeromonas hydrophila]
MSQKAAKVGDIGTDHDGFHPTAIISGSPDVFIDGIPAARVGDPLAPHDKPNNPPHPRSIASGSSTVFVNGKPLAITGGAVDCGGVIIGSGTVIVGDQAPAARSAAIATQPTAPVEIPAKNAYWPPYDFAQGKHLEVVYVTPPNDFAVLTLEEAKELLQNLYAEVGGKDTIGDINSYHGLLDGIKTTVETARGLGGLGVTAYTKNIKGVDYVIIKNYRRHAQTLMKGNKWKANNPKVVQAGIGINDVKGAVRYAKVNVGVEIVFATAVNGVDFIMRDEATLAEFVGNSAGDITKGLVSLGVASLAVIMVPATAGIVLTGFVFAISSFLTGKFLDYLDNQYGYSETLTNEIKGVLE